MHDVYLGLGSNLGDRKAMLTGAVKAVAALSDTRIVTTSGVYETPPMGPQDQGAYLNMAGHFQTKLRPEMLMSRCQEIERSLGRAEHHERRHWGPREIDIDLLFYADRMIQSPTLTVPHPGISERWFVLKPLADIAPKLIHPSLGKPISELLLALEKRESAGALP